MGAFVKAFWPSSWELQRWLEHTVGLFSVGMFSADDTDSGGWVTLVFKGHRWVSRGSLASGLPPGPKDGIRGGRRSWGSEGASKGWCEVYWALYYPSFHYLHPVGSRSSR